MPTYNETGSGGVLCSSVSYFEGSLLVKLTANIRGVGNCIASGTAEESIVYMPFIGGGIVGGTADRSLNVAITGNCLAGGEATVSAIYLVNGNCIASGTATNATVYNIKGSTLYLAGFQQSEVNLLSGIVSGKATATVDTTTDYTEATSAENEEGTGSDWVNRFNIIGLNNNYVKTKLISKRSNGLIVLFNFNIPNNSILWGAEAIAYGKFWTSLPTGHTHQMHITAGLGPGVARITYGQVADNFINTIKSQKIIFGSVDNPITDWVSSSDIPDDDIINDSTNFGVVYYFEGMLDNTAFIDTMYLKIKYRQNINP